MYNIGQLATVVVNLVLGNNATTLLFSLKVKSISEIDVVVIVKPWQSGNIDSLNYLINWLPYYQPDPEIVSSQATYTFAYSS